MEAGWKHSAPPAATIGNLSMDEFFYYLTPVAVGLVIVVLCFGLWNMMRQGSANLSQKLMRWRVGLQFVAICVIMLAIYFRA